MNNSISTANKTTVKIKKLCTVAAFCALAYACTFVLHISVSFLTFDVKDAVIAVGGMFFGPLSALVMSLTVSLVELVTISDTGLYGFIMNFIGSAAFSVTASLIYKYRRRLAGAYMGLACAVVAVTVLMMAANLIVTPKFTGMSVEAVAAMIPSLLLPFNLIKSLLNSALVILIYKPVSRALKAAKMAPPSPSHTAEQGYSGSERPRNTGKRYTVMSIAIAVLIIVVSILLLMCLKAEFKLFG